MKNASVAHWWEHSTLQSSKHVKAVFQLLLKNKSRGRGHINTRCRRRNCEHVGVRADGAEDIIKAIGVHILLFFRRVLEYEELYTLPCFTVCICGSVKAICSLSALSGSTRINLEMCVWPWTSQQTRQQQLSPLDPPVQHQIFTDLPSPLSRCGPDAHPDTPPTWTATTSLLAGGPAFATRPLQLVSAGASKHHFSFPFTTAAPCCSFLPA